MQPTARHIDTRNAFRLSAFTALACVLLCAVGFGRADAAPPVLWQTQGTGGAAGQVGQARANAVAPVGAPNAGNVFVGDQGQRRIAEFTAWGEFVKAWGWDVAPEGAPGDTPSDQFEICTEVCKGGIGTAPRNGVGQIDLPGGVAVDSNGNVYVFESLNARVQKFAPSGEFLLMWGGGVNQGGGTPSNPGDICTAEHVANGDTCGAGDFGTGDGEFPGTGTSGVSQQVTLIDITPSDEVFVGESERIQRFNTDGEHQANVALPGETVQHFAVDAAGNFYVAYRDSVNVSKANVHKLNSSGTATCSYAVANPRGLDVAPNGQVYVFSSRTPAGTGSRILRFGTSCTLAPLTQPIEEFPTGQPGDPTDLSNGSTGLAVSNCGTAQNSVYHSNNSPSFLRAYSQVPDPDLCGAPPERPPVITQTHAISVGTQSATVRARVNPLFWEDTAYFVQYATADCIEAEGWEAGCVQAQPAPPGIELGAGVVDAHVPTNGVTLFGLQPDTAYRYRFVAESGFDLPESNGPAFGAERRLRTFAPKPAARIDCANQVFRVGPSASLPDCRAYEMVSPLDKNNGDVNVAGMNLIGEQPELSRTTPTGGALTYSSYRAFENPVGAPKTSQYIARRDAQQGWSSESVSPPLTTKYVLALGVPSFENQYRALGEDLCSGWLLYDATPGLTGDELEGYANLYRRQHCGAGKGTFEVGVGEGQRQWMLPEPPAPSPNALNPEQFLLDLQGASADGRHAIMRVAENLTPFSVGTQRTCTGTPTGGAGQTVVSFQWLSGGVPATGAGATSATYTLDPTDAGRAVQCTVVATHTTGAAISGAIHVSNPVFVATPSGPLPAPPADPIAIEGEATLGSTLTCHAGEWARGPIDSYTYQWVRNGSEVLETETKAATSDTYEIEAADVASAANFQCVVSATNAHGTVSKASGNKVTPAAPDPPGAPDPEAPDARAEVSVHYQLYERHPGGLRAVCVLPNGAVINQNCSAGTANETPLRGNTNTPILGGRYQGVENAISADGSRIFWSANAGLFVRIGGSETIAISEGSGRRFHTAASDGSAAIFSAGGQLSHFDVDKALDLKQEGKTGAQIMAEATTSIAGGLVHGILGASEDATHVYFVSTEALTAEPNSEGNVAEGGQNNLYYRSVGGAVQFIGTLVAGAGGDIVQPGERRFGPTNVFPAYRTARVSADGLHVAFNSRAPLTGADNTDRQTGEALGEVFAYDAAAKALACVSCHPGGARPVGRNMALGHGGQAWMAAQLPPAQVQTYSRRPVSDDGSRIFFESFNPLVLGDTNGRRDVYQFSWADEPGECEGDGATATRSRTGDLWGCLALISSGKSPADSEFMDADRQGDNVFIATESNLVPQDYGLRDAYVARVNGGFPPPTGAAECEGEACQTPPAPPVPPTPASSAFAGPGNPRIAATRPRCGKGKVRRGNRCLAKRALARRACAKRKGKARQRCIRNQVRRLTRVERRQRRAANASGRAGR